MPFKPNSLNCAYRCLSGAGVPPASPGVSPANTPKPLPIMRSPHDTLQTGEGHSLAHRMGEGQGEGFLGTSVVYPKAQAVDSRARRPQASAGTPAPLLCLLLLLLSFPAPAQNEALP